jgi:glycosyltransferase involved in cell wall biosynthesis
MNTLIVQKNNLNYPRNLALIKCLKKIDPSWSSSFYEGNIFIKLKQLISADKVIFIWSAQQSLPWMIIAKLMRKEVVADMFNFYYETYVEDRKLAKERSLKAGIYFLLDYMCIKLANKVIVDTIEHGQYMTRLYGEVAYFVLPVVVDDELVDSVPVDTKTLTNGFNVLYCGKFIPLHGVEKIVEAANLLKHKPINFYLQGSGQTKNKIETLVNMLDLNEKIKFIDRLPYEQMLALMKSADVCLGIFGDSEKTKRVIPNKVLEALFCGRPVVTMTTISMKKLMNLDGVFLVDDVSSLASKIIVLYNDACGKELVINDNDLVKANFGINNSCKLISSILYE